ncbi:MAG: PAS domain-containing protein, partial [Gemmataceae bacterium]
MTISGDDATTAAANGWMSDAQAAGGTGIFRLDLRAGTWEWTPQVAVLFGLDPMTASPRSKDWENTIFSDDVPKVRAAIKTATKGGARYVDLRVRHPD